MKPKTSTERGKLFRAKQKALGKKERHIFLYDDHWQQVKALVKKLEASE